MDSVGIGAGFLAAAFQSLSYLGSRWFLQRSGGTPLQLLALSHLLMGAVAVVLFLTLSGPSMPPFSVYVVPGIGATGFYLIAQFGLFRALRHADSSQVVPMLGLKIFFLALVSVLFMQAHLNPWQWVSVLLSVGAVFLLNEKSGRLTWPAVVAVTVTVVGYSLSDLYIKKLVTALQPAGSQAALIGVSVTYMMGTLAGLPLLARGMPRTTAKSWGMAVPYAVAWFVSMLFLYVAFQHIGVVYGNIIQSTRGLMAIGLGYWVGRSLGMVDLERRLPHRVLLRRVAGALLMTAAIGLYLLR